MDSGRSLIGILNDILDCSKIEAGFINLEQADFDPVRTIRDVAKLFELQASSKGVDFSLDVPDEGPLCIVRGDGMRLHQMICKLVSNALKFTRDGSVTPKFRPVYPGRWIHYAKVWRDGVGPGDYPGAC